MLTEPQLELLRQRFPHFDAEAAAQLFHQDQPADGQRIARGQGRFPAVLMASDVWWYPDKERRPLKDGHPVKAKAPQGMRRLLFDTLEVQEILLVEGEGDAVAARSVGLHGVVAAGGTSTLLSRSGAAQAYRRDIFGGKSVRLLFDPDQAGRDSVDMVARKVLEAGAERVAIIHPEWPSGMDLEDWLASFPDAERAYGELLQLLESVTWQTLEEVQQREAEEDGEGNQVVQSHRIFVEGSPLPILLATVFSEQERQIALAVYNPHSETVNHDAACGWRVLDTWRHNDVVYVPDNSTDTLKNLYKRTLVLAPPPADDPGSSVQLWLDCRSFMVRWIAVPVYQYDGMVGYTFLSYRVEDAGFKHVPYLRFHGPPGSGKGRALEVMRALCWRSFDAQPTVDNIHRLLECMGDITVVFDEFHLGRGMPREATERLIDTLNLGNERSKAKIRMVPNGAGNEMTMQTFSVFGLKILAGYGNDEHEGLTRRTISVEMGQVPVPKPMALFDLPERFYQEAEQLRARLMAWRARKLKEGLPDPEGPRARMLLDKVGSEVGQAFWPLVEMVPAQLTEELGNLIRCAQERRTGTQVNRETSEESYLLEAVASLIDDGAAHTLGEGTHFLTTAAIHEKVSLRVALSANVVARKLASLGLKHCRQRVPIAGERVGRRGGVKLRDNDKQLAALMRRYGLEWPRMTDDMPDEERSPI